MAAGSVERERTVASRLVSLESEEEVGGRGVVEKGGSGS